MTIVWRAVRHVRASEEVAAQIVRAFYSEQLKPGEWLGTEAELAARFNVSRVTIRDAVGALSARGLLDVRVGARGGLRIARSDPERLIDAFSIQLGLMGLRRDELLEALQAIEPQTTALAAERASAEQVAGLLGLVSQSRALVDEPAEFTRLGVAFHQAIADASGNGALRASLGALRATQLEHLLPLTTRPLAERVARIHGSIAEAIAQHDAPLARQRMADHLAHIAASGACANVALVAAV
jgi:GntR family transcriptional repressor for pyruvate dehydrogenase complex